MAKVGLAVGGKFAKNWYSYGRESLDVVRTARAESSGVQTMMMNWKYGTAVAAMAAMMTGSVMQASQLSGDARSSIPKDVQQIIVVDYKAMQNSPAAMQLKDRVLPPELKRLESALKTSGLQIDQDAETLAFAAYKAPASSVPQPTQGGKDAPSSAGTRIIGVAQGQFQTASILAKFVKDKVKPVKYRNNDIYPMGNAGMSVAFLNQTTMVFGDKEAVKNALDARDGLVPNFLQNGDMMNSMAAVDSRAVWSLLDQKGTQTMMRSALGDAASLPDYDTVKGRMKDARYTMDFANGVKFEMTVDMSDTMTAATAATLMKGVAMMKKTSGSPIEKSAMDETQINSAGGVLSVDYSSSDSQFAGLLGSPLFQSVVK
jgi:hypothetical protein